MLTYFSNFKLVPAQKDLNYIIIRRINPVKNAINKGMYKNVVSLAFPTTFEL